MDSVKLFFLLFLCVSISFSACSNRMNSRDDHGIGQYEKQGFESVIVVDSRDIAGCGFLLLRQDSSFYRPLYLASEWQSAGMRLWVKVEVLKDAVSVCMRRRAVKILELKPDTR
jgi:hypothetical protein